MNSSSPVYASKKWCSWIIIWALGAWPMTKTSVTLVSLWRLNALPIDADSSTNLQFALGSPFVRISRYRRWIMGRNFVDEMWCSLWAFGYACDANYVEISSNQILDKKTSVPNRATIFEYFQYKKCRFFFFFIYRVAFHFLRFGLWSYKTEDNKRLTIKWLWFFSGTMKLPRNRNPIKTEI